MPGLPDFHPMTVLRDWSGESPEAAYRIADAQTGVICFGATGSGKTSSISRHFAVAYLALGFGGVVLCAKKEEREQWEKWAEEAGRWDRKTQRGDLIIFDKSGKWQFNFLDWEASRAGEGAGLTINIVALLDEIAGAIAGGASNAGDGAGDNKFFEDALHHMNTNLVDLPLLARVPVTLPLLRSILNSAPLTPEEAGSKAWKESDGDCATILRAAEAFTKDAGEDIRADYEECRSYWTKEFPALSEKTRSIITLSFSMLIRPLITRPLRKLFCSETNITPEDTFKGKVVIIDLPIQEFRLAGRIANLAWKYCFQVATLRRMQPNDGTYLRPVFLWADEAQNFVTEFDAEYQAVARSASGCTVYLVQNRESMLRALHSEAAVDSLLGNLQCKCFAQNSSPGTNEWASKILGERWKKITGINAGSSIADTMDAARTTSSGVTRQEQQRKYIEPAQFTTLKRGGPKHGFIVEVLIYNGGQLFTDPQSKEMLPYVLIPFNQRG